MKKYSRFPNALFGVPGQGKSGTVSFSLANNLEMKVKSDKDSIGEKKISLIENLNIQESYNFAADSLRWSDLSTSILLRLTKGFNLNLSATWDLYTYGLTPSGTPVKLDKLRIASGKGLGRLMRTGTSFSYTFNNDTFKKKKTRRRTMTKAMTRATALTRHPTTAAEATTTTTGRSSKWATTAMPNGKCRGASR